NTFRGYMPLLMNIYSLKATDEVAFSISVQIQVATVARCRDVHINTAWAFVLKLFNWLKILRCLFQLLGNLFGCDGSVLFLILAPVSTVLIQQFPYCPCHFNVPPLCFEVFSAMYCRTQAFRLNRKQHTADSFCS